MTERQWSHDEVEERLSEHLDGLLDGDARDRVEEHLDRCAPCRDTLAELRSIRDAARALPATGPSNDLWPGIRAQVLDTPVVPLRPVSGSDGRAGIVLSRRQLASAATILVALGALGAWSVAVATGMGGPVGQASAPGGEVTTVAIEGPGGDVASSYVGEIERLEALLADSRDALEPSTVQLLERNLDVIDRAIAESLEALRSDPANPFVRQHLERSFERKVDYLREAAELAAWSAAD